VTHSQGPCELKPLAVLSRVGLYIIIVQFNVDPIIVIKSSCQSTTIENPIERD
jgi:hypothetical protein